VIARENAGDLEVTKQLIKQYLAEHHGVQHSTLEFEFAGLDATTCKDQDTIAGH